MTAKDSKKQYISHFDTFSLSWIIHDHLTSLLRNQVTCCPTSLKLALGAWQKTSGAVPSVGNFPFQNIRPERRCWKIFQSARSWTLPWMKGKNPKRELKILGSTDIHLFMEEHLSFFNVSVKYFWMCWQLCLRYQLWRISHHLGLQIGLAVQIGCLNVHLVLCAGMVIQQRKNRSFIGARNEDVSSW